MPQAMELPDPVDIRRVVVIGAGAMGVAIAQALHCAGIEVDLVESDPDAAERARHYLARIAGPAGPARIAMAAGFGALAPAQVAIEAVNEDIALKKSVLAEMDRAFPQAAALVSTACGLDIDGLASATADPGRVVAMRYVGPAHVSRFVEIARGTHGADGAIAAGLALAGRLGSVAIVSGAASGGIATRLRRRCLEAAESVLINGSTPWEIDEAMVAFGFSMGPYEAQDITGLDVGYADRKARAAMADGQRSLAPISDRMVEEGRLGRKVGVGWYRYPGGGGAVVDPLIEDLVREEAYFAKVGRRDFSAEEIRARLLYAMIDEAACILGEGSARSAADIDLVSVHGLGFPVAAGGLMRHADMLGAQRVLDQLERFAKADAAAWRQSPQLRRLAATDGRFSDLHPSS